MANELNVIYETEDARFVSYYDWTILENEGKWSQKDMKIFRDTKVPVAQYKDKALIAIANKKQITNWIKDYIE